MWKSLVSCSDVKSNALSKHEMEHVWTCVIVSTFILLVAFTKKDT